jgi:hypothetical protein
MKWAHFLAKGNLFKAPEPLWYKKLSEMVIDIEEDNRSIKNNYIILRKFGEGKIILRKELPPSTRKECNKEIIMWKKGEEDMFSIKTKNREVKIMKKWVDI